MVTAQESRIPKTLLVSLFFLIVVLLGFNLALSRYGAFWRKAPSGVFPPSLSPPEKETLIGCPVPEEYCQTGKDILWEGKVVGVGFTLPPGTPMIAAFDGEPRPGAGTAQDGTDFRNIYMTNKDGYEAIYSFQGEIETLPFVAKRGEILGQVSGERVSSSWGDANLVFMVKKGGEVLPITSDSF